MKKSHLTIDRLTITGNYSESSEALDFCQNNGYRVVRSGPAPIKNENRYNMKRFLIVAEKEIKQ